MACALAVDLLVKSNCGQAQVNSHFDTGRTPPWRYPSRCLEGKGNPIMSLLVPLVSAPPHDASLGRLEEARRSSDCILARELGVHAHRRSCRGA